MQLLKHGDENFRLHTTTVTVLHMLVHMDKVTVLLANYD